MICKNDRVPAGGQGSHAVAAVVVTYNRRNLLSNCLSAIEAQTHRPDLIIVIDNASTDDTAAFLTDRSWNLPHQVHRLNRNYGGALGFAVGMKAALAAGADSVWLMDDDAIASQSALEFLIEDTKVATRGGRSPAFTCSMVVWRDGSVARMNIPRANALWNESAARLGPVGGRCGQRVVRLGAHPRRTHSRPRAAARRLLQVVRRHRVHACGCGGPMVRASAA
jgi:glycosyltransferase involved in cell wall biosynthesis